MAKRNNEELTAKWNERIGRKTGRHVAPKTNWQETEPAQIRAGQRATSARVRLGTQPLKPETKKQFQRQFGNGKIARSSASSFQRTMNRMVDDVLRDLQEKAINERAIETAMRNPGVPTPVVEEPSDPGFFDKVLGMGRSIPGAGPLLGANTPQNDFIERVKATNDVSTSSGEAPGHWQGLMEDFSRSPVGRGLDILNRPFNAVHTGFNTALEEDYRLRDEGKQQNNPLRFLDDLVEGMGAGITGKETTGAGDVWQTMRQNSDIAGAQELRNLEESHPGVTRWIDRTVGLAGEVTMDPLNWTGIGATGIVAKSGQQLTESTAKAAIRETVDTAVRDFYDDVVSTTGGLRYKPSADAIAEYAAQAAEDQIEKNLLEIHGGGYAGWGKMGGAQTAASASTRVTLAVREQIFKPLDRKLEAIYGALRQGGRLPINSWKTHLAQSPELREVLTKIETELAEKGRLYGNENELIASLTVSDIPMMERAANLVRSELDAPLFEYIASEVLRQTRQLYYNTIGIKVGRAGSKSPRIIPIKTFGKAYAYTKKALPERVKIGADNFAGAMSYERNLPGRMSLVTQNGRSVGAKAFEDFHKKWGKIARNYSKFDDEAVQQALQDSNKRLSPEQESLKLMIRDEYNQMHAQEMADGVRPEGNVLAEDYAYIFNKGGKAEDRKAFKADRKNTIQREGKAGRFNSDWAKNEKHLRPVEGAFDALLARKLKNVRDTGRAFFMKDLVENYGSMSKPLSEFTQDKLKLRPVSVNQLPQYMRDIAETQGVEFYLPEEHLKMFKTFNEISGWNSSDGRAFVREWAKLTNTIKYISTVPRLGFHVRNMVGDFFMGLLDKVPTRTYPEVVAKFERKQMGGNPGFRITKDINLTWDETWARYEQHANSGFYETEIPLGGASPSGLQRAENARKTLANKARKASDIREDYGRFVHFVAALRQEAAKINIKDPAKLLEKATESAVWRVNKYKFDYGALTAFERTIKLVFPFYTFTRKAAPTLLQTLALNPKYMAMVGRFMEYNDGSAADAFNHYYLPDYVKDIGYGFLNEDSEPLYITGDVLPTNVLNSLDFTNSQQFAQSLAQQINPVAQIPFEVGMGEETFSGQATGSFPEYIANKFSVPGQFKRQIDPSDNSSPGWLQALNESFTGAGIPVRQFTEEQQDFGYRNLEDRFIQDPFSEFNRSQEAIRIYQGSNGIFRVKDVTSGAILYEGNNPSQALVVAKGFVP